MTAAEAHPAGAFAPWLAEITDALHAGGTSRVPCGDCTACCTSAQFIHIGPDEADALAHIPAELLVAAPGLPRGHRVMGYDERGHCPMLVDGACSIYAHRPRTCRTYDCRVFAAAGVDPGAGQPLIASRARQWAFDHPTPADQQRQRAVRAAAAHLAGHPEVLPPGAPAPTPAQRALLAIEIHEVFLVEDLAGGLAVVDPGPDAVRAALARRVGTQAGPAGGGEGRM